MRTSLMLILVLSCVINSVWAAEYFPSTVGNYWLFGYKYSRGGWGAATTDSGTLKWEIKSIMATKSIPSQVTALIEQTRSLVHRTQTGGFIPGGTSYDSSFSPARVTLDSVYLHWLEPGNGISIDSDSCFVLIHDPAKLTWSDYISVGDTAVSFNGQRVAAKRLDPSECRDRGQGIPSCNDPKIFIAADGIGPMGYFMKSSPCLMDAFWGETWWLVQARISGSGIVAHDRGRSAPAGGRALSGSVETEVFSLTGRHLDARDALLKMNNRPSGVFFARSPAGKVRIKTSQVLR